MIVLTLRDHFWRIWLAPLEVPMIWSLLGLFGLNGLKTKMMLKPDPLLPNDLGNMKELSKFDNFEVRPLLWPSKFFWPFYIFPDNFKVYTVEINQSNLVFRNFSIKTVFTEELANRITVLCKFAILLNSSYLVLAGVEKFYFIHSFLIKATLYYK